MQGAAHGRAALPLPWPRCWPSSCPQVGMAGIPWIGPAPGGNVAREWVTAILCACAETLAPLGEEAPEHRHPMGCSG